MTTLQEAIAEVRANAPQYCAPGRGDTALEIVLRAAEESGRMRAALADVIEYLQAQLALADKLATAAELFEAHRADVGASVDSIFVAAKRLEQHRDIYQQARKRGANE
ncbi:hypothetical protein HY375_00665 [Candidatus Berkelbacteria bacterium]|nr:hypothetical protein [Candidatus Berkelbacteria bacterium]